MAEWFANMNIALYRIDTAGKTTQKPAAYEVPRGKIRSNKTRKHKSTHRTAGIS